MTMNRSGKPMSLTLPVKSVLTLECAQRLADTALRLALEKGLTNLVIAVVDDGGHLVVLLRQDQAEPAAVEIGIEKARTAALTRKATKVFKQMLLDGKTWVLGMPGITPVEGGQPISVSGATIGGIGVAGASGDIDTEIGSGALSALLSE